MHTHMNTHKRMAHEDYFMEPLVHWLLSRLSQRSYTVRSKEKGQMRLAFTPLFLLVPL